MIIKLDLGRNSYDIVVERGALGRADALLSLNRRVLIVTDDGVPSEYAKKIASFCEYPVIKTVKQGEKSKSIEVWQSLLSLMLKHGFTRTDCVAAVGGGVCGDLAGFAAASFMRGIDFYNIPTTLLSQVDSSIGGKTAVNLDGIKNIVGAFHQPKKVIIDPDVLKTLPKRQLSNGLAESIKMALTSDKDLFTLFENKDIYSNLDDIIVKSLMIKKHVVEQDEKESGFRRVLNFGHTIGHGIEAQGELYHGECVALGMIPMCSENVKERLIRVLQKADLPYYGDIDYQNVYNAAVHDKKVSGGKLTVVYVDSPGSFEFREISFADLKELIRGDL